MKCRAKQAAWAAGEERLMKEYGLMALDTLETVFALQLARNFPYFRGEGRLQSYYDGQAAFCEELVSRCVPDRMQVCGRQGPRRAEQWELLDDGAEDTLFILRRELSAAGFDCYIRCVL